MSVNDLIRLGIRRWYVFALGLVCALGASFAMKAEPWTFVAQTDFVMVASVESAGIRAPHDTQESLISFADVVTRLLNDEEPTHPLSSPTATLFGNGVRTGTSVRLLNSGTQWQSAFSGPIISVQVIGPSEIAVQKDLDNITSRIEGITKSIQDESGTSANSYITAETDPSRIVISAFGPSRTSRLKGTLLLMAFALCISTLSARGIDRARATGNRLHAPTDVPEVNAMESSRQGGAAG